MNKIEFLSSLERSLLRLSKSDRDDILLDYEEHFRAGMEQGMTEEEVADKLGDPGEIAAAYLENLPEDAKGAPAAEKKSEELAPVTAEAAETESTAAPQSVSGGRRVGNVFFWIGAVITIIALIYVWIACLCCVIGCFAAAAALVTIAVPAFSASVPAAVGFIFIGVGMVLMGVICIYALKYIIFGIKKLIAFFKRVSNKIMGRSIA